MNYLQRLFSRKPLPTEHVIVPVAQKAGLVKTGKWVLHLPTGQPGILNGVEAFPLVDVMLVNPIGENYRQERCTLDQIRIAKLSEIPAPRRPLPDHGASLGYF